MQSENYQAIVVFLVNWILFSVLVEALTELAKKAGPLEPIRSFLSIRSKFFAELLSCGWCLSVWVSFSLAWILPSPVSMLINYGFDNSITIFVESYLWWFVNGIILHRLSNILHMKVTSENDFFVEASDEEEAREA